MTKKTFIGKVVSDKMQKTVVVEVERRAPHPMYRKIVRKMKRFKADTNGMTVVVSDVVKIEETRPLSRDKHFKVIEKIGGKS